MRVRPPLIALALFVAGLGPSVAAQAPADEADDLVETAPTPPPPPRVLPTVLVAINVDGARVLVDGAPVGEAPLAPLELEPGSHELTVSAPGYEASTRRFELTEAGLRVDVRLPPATDAARVPDDDPTWTTASAATPLWKRWWLWAGVGAVVVVATIVAVAVAAGGSSVQEGFPVPPIPGRSP
ncbi:MAG: PEGA domain-containing protein [Myxococcales bacterium]|nr:PEGA domain-containing protein [Myxococcales bacterium]